MVGRLFTILSALSLLLCLASGVMWVRSYRTEQFAGLGEPPVFRDYRGQIIYTKTNSYEGKDYTHEALGFVVHHGPETQLIEEGIFVVDFVTEVAVPYWAVAVLFAALPGMFVLLRLKRLRRPLENCCPTCGYDLRATPAHCVREYRNAAIHDIGESDSLTFQECKSRLGVFLSFLPVRW